MDHARIAKAHVQREELLRLLLAGYSLREAANHMNASYYTVRMYVKRDDFLPKLKELSVEVYRRVDAEMGARKLSMLEKMEEASDEALETVLDLMRETKQDVVKMKCAQDLLDRNPQVSRTKRVDTTNEHMFVNPLTLVAAATAAREVDAFDARKREGGPAASAQPALPPAPEGTVPPEKIN
jgi:hypothetical protein